MKFVGSTYMDLPYKKYGAGYAPFCGGLQLYVLILELFAIFHYKQNMKRPNTIKWPIAGQLYAPAIVACGSRVSGCCQGSPTTKWPSTSQRTVAGHHAPR